MTRYNITYWDGLSATIVQCMDIEELITELEKVAHMQYVDVSTVHFSLG